MYEHPDEPRIRELIERAKTMPGSVGLAVWWEMHLYRAEALAEAAKGEDRFERELRVCLVRGKFRRRLEELHQLLAPED